MVPDVTRSGSSSSSALDQRERSTRSSDSRRQAPLSESVGMSAGQSAVSSSCQLLRKIPELADAIPAALTGRKSRSTPRGTVAKPGAGRRCLDGPRERQRPGPGGTARARSAGADAVPGRRTDRALAGVLPAGPRGRQRSRTTRHGPGRRTLAVRRLAAWTGSAVLGSAWWPLPTGALALAPHRRGRGSALDSVVALEADPCLPSGRRRRRAGRVRRQWRGDC